LVDYDFYPCDSFGLETHRNSSDISGASEIKICLTVKEATEGEPE